MTENVLIDANGNMKITDFGLSALPQHFWDDGLLRQTCGSPDYIAPEIFSNGCYNGVTLDIWSCSVILYIILTGYLPFNDRYLAISINVKLISLLNESSFGIAFLDIDC